MSYRVAKNNESMFEVIENMTNQVIFRTEEYGKAKGMYKHLKSGGGFAGNTPPFFFYDNFVVTE